MTDRSLDERRRAGAQLQARLPEGRSRHGRDGMAEGGCLAADLIAELGWVGVLAAATIGTTAGRRRKQRG